MADEALTPSIPGWSCLGKIGSGGMSTVWKARQDAVDRVVALKVLAPEFARTQAEVDRFRDEARAAAAISHPGIVKVYDVFKADGRFCLAMEYVDGSPLSSLLRARGKLPEDEALAVAAKVAEALGYAWDTQRLVHLDVKPENILVSSSGEVKLADFGLSRSLKTVPAFEGDPQDDEICGTPAYMSPEQAAGSANLDARADMYSLGATLFHAVTGHRLFAGVPDTEIPKYQLSAETSPADPDTTSPPFHALVRRLLAKKPQDRFATWEEASAAIAAVAAGNFPAGCGPDPISVSSTLAPRGEEVRRRELARKIAPFCSSRVRAVAVAVFVAASALLLLAAIRTFSRNAGAVSAPQTAVIENN